MPSMKNKFPLFKHYQSKHAVPLGYLDSASTTQMPEQVISAVSHCMTHSHANVHRANYPLGLDAQNLFFDARKTIGQFIGASSSQQIVFTKSCTESINLLASTIVKGRLKPGDEIILSVLEHHANWLPWRELSQLMNVKLKVIPLDRHGRLDFEAFRELISDRTRVLALTHTSNVTGEIVDIKRYVDSIKSFDCLSIVDGAQALAHTPVNVHDLGCDFYCFSAHKMYGPQGVGGLYGKTKQLSDIAYWLLGGNMVDYFDEAKLVLQAIPERLEAGTPNLAGICGMAEAANFLRIHGEDYAKREQRLKSHLLEKLSNLPLSYLSPSDAPIVSFSLTDGGEQDLCDLLTSQHIALRTGQHCATPLLRHLELNSCLRISLGAYNDEQDIESLLSAIAAYFKKRNNKPKLSQTNIETSPALLPKEKLSREAFLKHLKILGSSSKRLADKQKTQVNEIKECEVRSWLRIDNNPHLTIESDSESTLVRGLLSLVTTIAFEKIHLGVTSLTIEDLDALTANLHHLSQTRRKTVVKMLARINEFLEQE